MTHARIARAAVLLGLLAPAGCSPGAQAKGAAGGAGAAGPPTGAPVPVRAGLLEQRTVARRVEISGSLASPEDATIAAEVEGKILGCRVDLGDRVGAGQVLARVASDEYRLRMEQADALARQAEANLARTGKLARTQMVAEKELDDARFSSLQLRAAADLAKKKYADTEVRAPFSGAIGKRLVSTGEYVKVGQPLFQVVQLDPLKLTGEVPERYLADIKVGDPLEAYVDAFPGEVFQGKVSRLSPTVNPQSRAFSIEARFAAGSGKGMRLRPGVFARAVLRLGRAESALAAPQAAIATFAGVSRIFVLDGGVAREHVVELGDRLAEDRVVVRGKGLGAGMRVATAGVARLAEGVPVTVLEGGK